MTCDNSGNVIVAGSLTSNSLATDTRIYNSGGNANLKIQGSASVIRMECDGSKNLNVWNDSNQDIAIFYNNRESRFKAQIWVEGDVNSTGGYYQSGVFVASSKEIQKNIKDIPDNNIFNNLSLKQYQKIINNDENEIGYIAEEVESLDVNNKFNLVKMKDGIKHLNYNSLFLLGMEEIQKLRKEINELKNKK